MTLLISSFCYSQITKVDTLIIENKYKSYYSYEYKNPAYVVYTMPKSTPENSCDSYGYDFLEVYPRMATGKDYAYSGFDRGHLVPEEEISDS
jgi:DNA/RNA endonuclease G (NUC1)